VGRKGLLVVISGPSGSGKTTIVERVVKDLHLVKSVSATTRRPRAGEVPGKDYHFLSRDEFVEAARRGEFVEYANVFGEFYGTPRRALEDSLSRGETMVLEIDVQGARAIRSKYPDALTIFIEPPSVEALVERLTNRSTDSSEEIRKRTDFARKEMAEKGNYHFSVVNDDLQKAVREVERIISGHMREGNPRDERIQRGGSLEQGRRKV